MYISAFIYVYNFSLLSTYQQHFPYMDTLERAPNVYNCLKKSMYKFTEHWYVQQQTQTPPLWTLGSDS